MRDILISSAVFVAFLAVALISQLVTPASVAATPTPVEPAVQSRGSSQPAAVVAPLDLDPSDPNPTLFAMAPGATAPASASDAGSANDLIAQTSGEADAAALGGEILAAKEIITPSGLRITDLVEGTGSEARAGQAVLVNYRGTLENGREFDSSYGRGPFRFPLGGGKVIKGWDEGVDGMKVGGKRKLVIPPDLGYGQRGAGGIIPPNATLIFEVELLEVES